MSGYLDIIFLLVLVVIIFSRLKSILGTGSEDAKIIMVPKEQFEKVYKEMKKTAAFEADDMPDMENLSPLDRDLAKIPEFNKNIFIKGAQRAFEMILSAFSKGDSSTLSKLVDKELLKKFENDKDGFESFEKSQLILKNSGIKIPKVYLWDKKTMIAVVEFIEGPTAFDILVKNDLEEKYIEKVFKDLWYARTARIYLDFDPRNFFISGDDLIYWPFKYKNYDNKNDFLDRDYKLWIFTKEFAAFAKSLDYEVDTSRIKNDYEINKIMTLLGVKYYR